MDPPSQIEPRGERYKGVAIAISSHLLILPPLLSYDSTLSSLRLVPLTSDHSSILFIHSVRSRAPFACLFIQEIRVLGQWMSGAARNNAIRARANIFIRQWGKKGGGDFWEFTCTLHVIPVDKDIFSRSKINLELVSNDLSDHYLSPFTCASQHFYGYAMALASLLLLPWAWPFPPAGKWREGGRNRERIDWMICLAGNGLRVIAVRDENRRNTKSTV